MNKGFDTATTTVKDAITQRASDLKVSRDATLNTAIANLNKLSTAEFNDNNIVGSIAVDAGINDPASRRAYEEQVNTLRNARREEDEAIAKEKQKEKLRPLAVKKAEADVDNTYASSDNLRASANNQNASAASIRQQTGANAWKHGNEVSQQKFEQNYAGLLGELPNANPGYFTQANYNKATEGMSSADKLLFTNEWVKKRDASITRGGTQFDAEAAVINAQSKLDQAEQQNTWESQGKALADEGLAPNEVEARVRQLFPDNAIAAAAVTKYYTTARKGVSDANTGLTNQGNTESIAAATQYGASVAASTPNPIEAEADIDSMFPRGSAENTEARRSHAAAVNKAATATRKGTESAAATTEADTREAVRMFMSDPATLLRASAMAAGANPDADIDAEVQNVPASQQAAFRAAWKEAVAAQATNMANQFVELNADPILKDMLDPAKNSYEVLTNSLNGIKSPAVKAEVQKILLERMDASGVNGARIAAVVKGKTREVEAALTAQVNKLNPDITNLAAQNLNGTLTDAEVKTAISVLAAGDSDLQEGLTVQFNKVRGQFNTLSTQDRQKLDMDSAALNREYEAALAAATAEANSTKNSHPVDAAVAPITSANQVQQNMANKLVKVKATEGEVWNDFEPSQVAEKINGTFNDADFKKELSNQLSAFSKQVSAAVAAGKIPEDTGKRIIDTLYNDPAVMNAIQNTIINTVIQPGADGVLKVTTYGYNYGGNLQEVENALPAAVIAVGNNVLNNEIQQEVDAKLLRKTSALQTENDAKIVKLGKRFQVNPVVPKK